MDLPMISLAERLGLQQRLTVVLGGDLEARTAAALLARADDVGSVTMSQAQLAGLLGAQRTSVQRVLKQLEAGGLVTTGYRRVELLDRGGLATLVTGSSAT